jgi:hypothetical protein
LASMISEGPVYTYYFYFLLTRGRPFVPSFCLSYYEPIPPPASPLAWASVGVPLSHFCFIVPNN